MKKTKNIIIGGINFELIKSINTPRELKALCECYAKPSTTKWLIYDEWLRLAYNNLNVTKFGVASFNSMIFTLYFEFENNSRKYKAYITPSHNYICEVSN